MDLADLALLRRGQVDQFIGVVVGEPVGGLYPTAQHATGGNRPIGSQLHPDAPGGAALASHQAEGPGGQLQREHRQAAAAQIKAGSPSPGLQIEGITRGHQSAGIGHVNPQARGPLVWLLEGQAIVDVAGIDIVDRDQVLVAEIRAQLIARLGLAMGLQQPLAFRLQLGTEAQLPAGVSQRGQAMQVPKSQIHQQMANRAGVGGTASHL